MKNECSVVQDLLPLYLEEMVQENTASFVKEHLVQCPRCRAKVDTSRRRDCLKC